MIHSDEVYRKLQTILKSVPICFVENFVRELRKITPAEDCKLADWRNSCGYDFDNNLIRCNAIVKISPVIESLTDELFVLKKIFSLLDIQKLQSIDTDYQRLSEFSAQITKLDFSPVYFPDKETGIFHFTIYSEVKDLVEFANFRTEIEEKNPCR